MFNKKCKELLSRLNSLEEYLGVKYSPGEYDYESRHYIEDRDSWSLLAKLKKLLPKEKN